MIVIFAADHVYVTNSLGLSKANINRRSVQPHARGLFGEFIVDPGTPGTDRGSNGSGGSADLESGLECLVCGGTGEKHGTGH